MKRQDKQSILDVFPRIIRMLQLEPIEGRLWIVTGERVRIREGK
jgi:hypothetical protein